MKKVLFLSACFAATMVSDVEARQDGPHHHGHHEHHQSEVAALKAQLEVLQARLEKLESAQTPQSTPKTAPAGLPVVSGGSKLSLQLSGQVNRSIQMASDGDRTRTKHVEQDADASQVRVVASAPLNGDVTASAKWEVAARSNSSGSAALASVTSGATTTSTDGGNTVENRKVEVMLDSKRYGKVYLGRGNLASYNIGGDTDLSGTTVVASSSSFQDAGGGVYFVDSGPPHSRNVGAGGAGIRVSDVVDGFRGQRDNRVRYDTPAFWGKLVLSASHMGRTNDTFDFAGRFNHEFSGVKFSAGAALTHAHLNAVETPASKDSYQQYMGTLGILLPCGLNAHGVLGQRHYDKTHIATGSLWMAKIGYIWRYFNLGKTAFAVDYGNFKDLFPADQTLLQKYDTKAWGSFLVQSLEKVSTDLYLGVRQYRLNAGNTAAAGAPVVNGKYQDVTVGLFGARVVF